MHMLTPSSAILIYRLCSCMWKCDAAPSWQDVQLPSGTAPWMALRLDSFQQLQSPLAKPANKDLVPIFVWSDSSNSFLVLSLFTAFCQLPPLFKGASERSRLQHFCFPSPLQACAFCLSCFNKVNVLIFQSKAKTRGRVFKSNNYFAFFSNVIILKVVLINEVLWESQEHLVTERQVLGEDLVWPLLTMKYFLSKKIFTWHCLIFVNLSSFYSCQNSFLFRKENVR